MDLLSKCPVFESLGMQELAPLLVGISLMGNKEKKRKLCFF